MCKSNFVWKRAFFAYSIIIERTATGIVKRKAWFQRNDYYRCHQYGRLLAVPEDVKSCFLKSINAGCDMLLFTKNLKEDYETVLEAVKSGIISEERLNEAVTYILATKASLKLYEKQKSHTLIPDESALDILRCKKHIDMAYQVIR